MPERTADSAASGEPGAVTACSIIRTIRLFGSEQPPGGVKHVLVRHRRSTCDLTGVVHDITGSVFGGEGCYAIRCSREEALHHARILAEMEGISTIYIRDET